MKNFWSDDFYIKLKIKLHKMVWFFVWKSSDGRKKCQPKGGRAFSNGYLWAFAYRNCWRIWILNDFSWFYHDFIMRDISLWSAFCLFVVCYILHRSSSQTKQNKFANLKDLSCTHHVEKQNSQKNQTLENWMQLIVKNRGMQIL